MSHPSRLTRRQALLAGGVMLPAGLVAVAATSRGSRADAVPLRTREAVRIVDAQASRDGAGVNLHRALGSEALSSLDPFLLLDEMHSDRPEDYIAGFPTHPHRGFETVTYVLDGAVDHRDSLGNHGHLGSGSVQWMTAGRGIVHSEMPTHEAAKSTLWGFQLWVNLPAALKMTRPRYQDLGAARIAEIAVQDASVRIIAGQIGDTRGPVEGIVTLPLFFDAKLPPKGRVSQALPPGHNGFVYVIDGEITLGQEQTLVKQGQLAVLGAGDVALARSAPGGRFLLAAGRPIGEPVARSGPFVMNTQRELAQAWEDYRAGRLVQAS